MIHHRHTRGKVLDLNSEVCPDSYLEDTKIGEKADVYQSRLLRSWADNSKVIKSFVEDSYIRGSELFTCDLDNTELQDCRLYDASVFHSKLNGVQARGAAIMGCTIDADVQIGKAELVGLTITRPMRIGVGFWDRVPRSFEIVNDIASFVVTESTDKYAYVGCQRKPIETWIKGSERYRKVMGWTPEMVDEIVGHFITWLEDDGNNN